MDYAIAVEQLMGVAEYGSAKTYADLVRTWRDDRPVPTEAELDTSWQAYLTLQQAEEDSQQEHRAIRNIDLNTLDVGSQQLVRALVQKVQQLESDLGQLLED